MSSSTAHTNKEDLRKAGFKLVTQNDGNVPADSDLSATKILSPNLPFQTQQSNPRQPPQSLLDSTPSKPKSDIIEERRANLPLPDQPPVASDWNSADARTVNVGSGGTESDVSYAGGSGDGLRGPATVDSSVRTEGAEGARGVGREAVEGE